MFNWFVCLVRSKVGTIMVHLVYFSNVSENTHRFMERLVSSGVAEGVPVSAIRLPLKGEQPVIAEDYVLVVPAYGTERNNHIPPQVKKFLADATTRSHCVGVVGTGNINFGEEYAVSGDILSHKLQVPLLWKFELSGFDEDISMMLRICQLTRESIAELLVDQV